MPVELFEMTTHEPEVAHRFLTEVYTPERPIRFDGSAVGFACHLRSAFSEQVAADQLSISVGGHTTIAPPDCFMVASGVRGTCRYTSRRSEVLLAPGGVYRFSTADHVVARNEALALNTLRVPLAVIERVAAERFEVSAGPEAVAGGGGGGSSGVGVRFEGHSPLNDGLRRGWLHVTAFARSQLDPAGAGGSSPLVAAALGELVAATALVTFPNSPCLRSRAPVLGG